MSGTGPASWRLAVLDVPDGWFIFRGEPEPRETMTNAAPVSNYDEVPMDPLAWREEFRRRMAERGILVRLPMPDPNWTLPEPLPIDADEMSRFVVELRRSGKL
jgi:hypothetical protein